jgi:hypothetical protein
MRPPSSRSQVSSCGYVGVAQGASLSRKSSTTAASSVPLGDQDAGGADRPEGLHAQRCDELALADIAEGE